MGERLRVQHGGDGEPVLLLLHGLGASGDVWNGLHDVLSGRWPGRWVTPDLPGHGGSDPLAGYSFGRLAAAVAPAVPSGRRVVALGHSLGGAVALALASGWFGVRVSAVCGLGIKVVWTDEELARARVLSARLNPVYATRGEAADRHLRVAGLSGLVARTPWGMPHSCTVKTAGPLPSIPRRFRSAPRTWSACSEPRVLP